MSPDSNPKVDTITNVLRERIEKGVYGTEGRLPSLRMLAKQFDTTHETMNKVVQRLQAEGLLLSYGRAGVFVGPKQTPILGLTRNFAQYLWDYRGETLIEEDLARPSMIPAPLDVAGKLGVAENALVVRRYHRQGTEKGFYRSVESYFPGQLVGEEVLEQMQQDERFDVLAAIKRLHGLEVRSVHDDVLARLATSEEEKLFSIVRNAPVFDVRRTSYGADEDGPVLMFNRLILVASQFVLSYDYIPYWLADRPSTG